MQREACADATAPATFLVKTYEHVGPDDWHKGMSISGRYNDLIFEDDGGLGSIIDDVTCGLVRFRGEIDVDTLQRDPLNSKVARMLVTQPPISKLELAVSYVLAGGDVWSEYVSNPAGVTVSDVLRKLHEMRHAYEDSAAKANGSGTGKACTSGPKWPSQLKSRLLAIRSRTRRTNSKYRVGAGCLPLVTLQKPHVDQMSNES